MSLLTYIFEATAAEFNNSQAGKTVTRPALIHADGVNVTYSVDVDIGEEGAIDDNGTIGPIYLYNVPIAAGTRNLVYAEIGSAVMLAKNGGGQWEVVGFSKTLPNLYTVIPVEIPVYCLRVPTEYRPGDPTSGPPGSIPGEPIYHPPALGEPTYYGETLRLLTYDDLQVYGTYGSIPYGAVGVFVNDEFIEWRTV